VLSDFYKVFSSKLMIVYHEIPLLAIECSDISVTMNMNMHISFDDAEEELKRMEEFRKAQAEIDKRNDAKAASQKMFKVI